MTGDPTDKTANTSGAKLVYGSKGFEQKQSKHHHDDDDDGEKVKAIARWVQVYTSGPLGLFNKFTRPTFGRREIEREREKRKTTCKYFGGNKWNNKKKIKKIKKDKKR